MGLITRLFSISFKLTLATSLILFSILIVPDQFFGDLKFDPQPKKVSQTAANIPSNLKIIQPTLDQIQKLEVDKEILEPESIKFHNNFIYTGQVNGQILKIDEKNKKVSVLTTLVDKQAKNCENSKIPLEICGRPLDLEIVGNILYAVDTYHGFIEYDLVKNTKVTYDLNDKIPGYETNENIFNSIRQDPINSNIIYLSLSSTKYNFNKIFFTFLELEDSGILIAFNKLTKKVTVIGKEFRLANGLEIVQGSLLLNELCNQRILKFDLKEINKFLESGRGNLPNYTVFKDVPGLPDNLTKDKTRLFVTLFEHIPENSVFELIFSNVHLRKLIHRLVYLASLSLKFIGNYYECDFIEKLRGSIESGEILLTMPYYKSAVAILDQQTGNYVALIHLPINFITHAAYNPQTNSLYLGSIVHKQISKLSLNL